MSKPKFVLSAAPIVEAVVDIDCDVPTVEDIEALDAASKSAFADHYSKSKRRMVSEHQLSMEPGKSPAVTSRAGLQSLLYMSDDEKQ